MTDLNPYAPPTAVVADVLPVGEAAPPLWNPGAAGAWSLLLSPIFGSYLHTRNWEALGQPEKAATSRKWMYVAIAYFVVVILSGLAVPESKTADLLTRTGGLAVLIAWYYAIGKSQQAYVAARFGKDYPRRGWGKPLLAALGVFVGFFVLGFVLAMLAS